MIRLITETQELSNCFAGLCRKYNKLRFAVAWCGDPADGFPYTYLDSISGPINGIVGTNFDHSHPDGIRELADKCSSLHIVVHQEGVFHPKMYLFENRASAAILVGSPNFTKMGFSANDEAILLIEDKKGRMSNHIRVVQDAFEKWSSRRYSIIFNESWLRKYARRYKRAVHALAKKGKKTSPIFTDMEKITPLTFLMSASWNDFFQRVQENRSREAKYLRRPEDYWTYVLRRAQSVLPRRWTPSCFGDKNLRRLMIGTHRKKDELGAFGHVGAAGDIRHLLAKGTHTERAVIARTMNSVARMSRSSVADNLLTVLKSLTRLGPTMRVWGRFLLLVRPDLFFTVSRRQLRRNLSAQLGIDHAEFSKPTGYLHAVQAIHRTPWFNSAPPRNREERFVWDHRAAFVDAILRDA